MKLKHLRYNEEHKIEGSFDVFPFSDRTSKTILQNLQANILIGQKKKYLYLVYVIFDNEKEYLTNQDWLKKISFLKGFEVTSAYKHRAQEYRIRRNKREHFEYNGDPIVGVYLSKTGLNTIGIEEGINTRGEERTPPRDEAFNRGMKNSKTCKYLNDDHSGWEDYFKEDIHVMLMMAHNYEDKMEDWFLKVKDSLRGVGRIVGPPMANGEAGPEKGMRWNKYLEHFEFGDGLSQPIFWNKKTSFSGILEKDKLDHVLFKSKDLDFASYLVLRKLEQNVAAFNRKVEAIIAAFKKVKVQLTKTHAEALIMGRFKEDDVPIIMVNDPLSYVPSGKNDKRAKRLFDRFRITEENESLFEKKDKEGLICPFHAHIRKANPRNKEILSEENYPDATGGDSQKVKIRIVRRGVTYGDRDINQKDLPEEGLGILFMCFQASISCQFEKIQAKWLHDRNFPTSDFMDIPGLDPLVGRFEKRDKDRGVKNTLEYRVKTKKGIKSVKIDFDSEELVRVKGGEYFFAPSRSFLLELKELRESLDT